MELVQTLSLMDTVAGFGMGVLVAMGVFSRQWASKPRKVNALLLKYQAQYAGFDKKYTEFKERSLAVYHDFTANWPQMEFKNHVHGLKSIDELLSHKESMLELLNELDTRHVSRRRLRKIRKELSRLNNKMNNNTDSGERSLSFAEQQVGWAVSNVDKARSDYNQLEKSFEVLTKMTNDVKKKYDPMYISEVGPAYAKAKEALEKYQVMLMEPKWNDARRPVEAVWGGIPSRAEKALSKLNDQLVHAASFQDVVFRATGFLRKQINQFAKKDSMLYDKLMRIVVEAESHEYVTRNPRQEFEKIIAPAIRILEPNS